MMSKELDLLLKTPLLGIFSTDIIKDFEEEFRRGERLPIKNLDFEKQNIDTDEGEMNWNLKTLS